MKMATTDAIFMHCLPASREEEVTNEVMDGKQSVVWLEALNRIHVQKSIIQWCLKLIFIVKVMDCRYFHSSRE